MIEMDISKIIEDVANLTAQKKKSYTFLDAIGQSTREMTHSSFLAHLLDPNENHAFGDKFAESFIKLLKEKSKTIEFNLPIVHVEVEKNFGREREENGQAIGGRADIYLEDSNGNIIVIENKIFAGDGDRQIE